MKYYQHICAQNDANGNPRRLYLLYDGVGGVVVVDEGYSGLTGAVPDYRERIALMTINVSAEEYQEILDAY